jgi:hypothetical protein
MNRFLRRWSGPWIAALLATAAGVWTVPAFAQTADADELRNAARDRYREGRRLLNEGRAVDALQELAASYQLFPSWAALYGMAMCQEALGRPDQARDLYEQTLREFGDSMPASDREAIESRVAELRGGSGVPAAAGVLVVTSDPPGAAVRIDGRPAGTTPLRSEVAAGPHEVTVAFEGATPETRSVDVQAGREATVAFVSGPSGETGRLVVRAEPAGTAFVDGRSIGATPAGPVEVPVGEVEVRVDGEGGRTWTERVAVEAGRTITVDVRFGVSAGLDPLWFWIAAGAAGGLAIGGAATGGYVLSLKDEYDDPATDPARRDEIRDVGDPLRIVTDALFGAAAAAAVAAVTLVFFTDWSGDGSSAEFSVEPAPAEGTDDAALLGPVW